MICNIPSVKLGIVAVSRNCFPKSLSMKRRQAVVGECRKAGIDIFEAQTLVQNEKDVLSALGEVNENCVNALVVFLGNFGPEGPETMLAQKFAGPCMFVAAAEESGDNLIDGRGDAFCGMLNASYNLRIRGVNAYIPEYPIGTAPEAASMIKDFEVIAQAYIGVKNLKIFGFGPRPSDFVACNAPIRQFFDLGVEVEENSELDLFEAFNKHAGDNRISDVVADMAAELGREGNTYPSVLEKLAQFELTLLDWYEANRGASLYGVFADKCWPAFQTQFGFVPCYVNSRMAAKGIPVACETDMYGALSEYILECVTGGTPTLLDINNTVPKDIFDKNNIGKYAHSDLFMGFHCGNTAMCLLKKGVMKHQLIMKRSLEPDSEPNVSRGTLEGTIKSGDITLFRLQGNPTGSLKSYIAQGLVLDTDPQSFGAIGIIAVPEMGRFYRHVLIQNGFPHHAGVGFGHVGRYLFEVLKLLGVDDIYYNQPKTLLYKTENPFGE